MPVRLSSRHCGRGPDSSGPEIQAIAIHRLRTGCGRTCHHKSGRTRYRASRCRWTILAWIRSYRRRRSADCAAQRRKAQPPLKIEAGQRVTRQIDLASLYPVHDLALIMYERMFISRIWGNFSILRTRVFEVTDARPIWQQTVGIPDGVARLGRCARAPLITNRFPDHTSLYVRVQDKDHRCCLCDLFVRPDISFEQPQAEIDRANQLHVLHCAAPRAWSYSRIDLNGELLTHSSFMETKTRPRLVHSANGEIAVRGGVTETPARNSASKAPKLSARPPAEPTND